LVVGGFRYMVAASEMAAGTPPLLQIAELGGDRTPMPATLLARIADSLKRYQVSPADFSEQVLARLAPSDPGWHVVEALELEDLVLAYACRRCDPSAMLAFERDCGGEFEAVVRKLRLDSAREADLRQLLWQRLFVGTDGPPKIQEYRGTGPLRHWFRVLATRFLLNEQRRSKREQLVLGSEYEELGIATAFDPELALLESSFRQQFRQALKAALRDLRPDQRNALRCHYLLAMTIDQMAEVFGVHRATAARRVVQAREKLLCHTRDRLRLVVGGDSEEIDSVIHRAQGQSSFSIARLLEQSAVQNGTGRSRVDAE
jgi:RNA polymerase sigma-70 factor, ECF subfamily